MKIRVVISGRSYDAAAELPEQVELFEGAGVNEAVTALHELLGEGGRLPESCLVAVSGSHLGTLGNHQSRVLTDGDELVIIAPVAGG